MDGVALDNDCGIRIFRESGLEGLYLREGLAVVKRNGEGEGRSDAWDADGVIDEENSSAVVGVEVIPLLLFGRLVGYALHQVLPPS